MKPADACLQCGAPLADGPSRCPGYCATCATTPPAEDKPHSHDLEATDEAVARARRNAGQVLEVLRHFAAGHGIEETAVLAELAPARVVELRAVLLES